MKELPSRHIKTRWATREQFNGSLRLVLDNLAGGATNRTAA
jgi:hypothetical protein